MAEGCGHANKFTCPYHAWTFSTEGDLVAIYSNDQFGDLDKSEHGLTELPCLERAGLIWVTVSQILSCRLKISYQATMRYWLNSDLRHGTTTQLSVWLGRIGRWPMTGTSITTICPSCIGKRSVPRLVTKRITTVGVPTRTWVAPMRLGRSSKMRRRKTGPLSDC